ncbi:hypothetical protein OROGR_022639 [Orobanche gracilis]
MSIPEDAEPGAFSGQRQLQQQLSINFASTIPIKKRRFPIIGPPSSSPQEKIPNYEEHESKRKQEYEISDEGKPALIDARNTPSLGNSDVSKTSTSIVRKEATPSNIKSGQANMDIFAPTPQEIKPIINLNPVTDLGNTLDIDIVSKEKSSDTEVEGSQSHTVNVKQEILNGQAGGICALELSTDLMSVELSLGPKKFIFPPLDCKKNEAICSMSDRSDPSLLSLALSEEKLAWVEKSDSTLGDLDSQASANRSNWNLNTTMDVSEHSMDYEEFAHTLADVCGFGNTDSLLRETHEFATEISDIQCCRDEKSSLTTDGTIGLGLNKEKCVYSSNSTTIQPNQQCNTDDSLGLRLAMPHRDLDARKGNLSSSGNGFSTSASPDSRLLHVNFNVTRGVKSEPVDENSKRDCSVGSSSSSNMRLLKLSSVKKEFVNNHTLETVLPSSVCPGELINYSMSMNSEDGALPQSVARLMQHQESCASSSSSSSLLLPQSSCNLTLPIFTELMPNLNLSNHLKNSFHGKQLRPCSVGNSSIVDPNKHKLSRVDEGTVELCLHGDEAKDDDEKFNISAEINEESIESDCGAVNNLMDIGENIRDKQDEEYEDGEVRESIQCSTIKEPFNVGKETENFDFAACDSQNLQPSDLSGDEVVRTSDGKDFAMENRQGTYSDLNKDRISVCSDDYALLKVSDSVLELEVDEKTIVSVTPDNQLDPLGRKDVEENPQKELSIDRVVNVNCGIGVQLEYVATCKVVKEICSGDNNLTLSKVKASLQGHDGAKDSSDASNKSRIINLSCGSVVTSPCKTSIPNRLLTMRSGNESYSDLDGEMQLRGNRDEIYTGSWNKYAKDMVHNQPLRNSGPSFMHGRGRMSNRFGSLRSDWASNHDFADETSYCPSDYQPVTVRRKHVSDAEIECNGYDIQHDSSALDSNNNRRKSVDNEFRRRTSLRRFSPGDRDGPQNRGNQRPHRFPRNMNPNRRNDDKFIQHLSDDIANPVHNHPSQTMYDEFDGQEQLVHGNRNFSTMQKKSHPQNHLKSPGRSRIRSPGPWSSSPQRRSPPFYNRMGRMRLHDRACFRDEMVFRRRGSPSYVDGHPNHVDSGREHVHHRRSPNPSRRRSPDQVFHRSGKRTDPLDSDSDQYMNKFHELRGDRSIDERRKFTEGRGPGPVRTFQSGYNGECENFRFHRNDGPRPSYRFCPDVDKEFVGGGNAREREFDGRVNLKHQTSVVSRRVRKVEEQEDENYRPVERVWHDDGFVDGRDKRRRF